MSLLGTKQREEMRERWEGTFHRVEAAAWKVTMGMELQVEEADSHGGSHEFAEGACIELAWVVGVVSVTGSRRCEALHKKEVHRRVDGEV